MGGIAQAVVSKALRAANKTVAAGFSLRGKDAPVKGAATWESVLSGALNQAQEFYRVRLLP